MPALCRNKADTPHSPDLTLYHHGPKSLYSVAHSTPVCSFSGLPAMLCSNSICQRADHAPLASDTESLDTLPQRAVHHARLGKHDMWSMSCMCKQRHRMVRRSRMHTEVNAKLSGRAHHAAQASTFSSDHGSFYTCQSPVGPLVRPPLVEHLSDH